MRLSNSDSNSASLLRVSALLDERSLAVIAGFVLVLALQFTSVSNVQEDVS
jgi:hypothetical protein